MQRHLKLLRAIHDASDDPEKAYLVRSRLRRALIALNRGFYNDRRTAALAPDLQDAVRRIEQGALRLCQPSEALDLRWKRDWAALSQELRELETRLAGVSTSRRVA
jgi:hypothetical protein